MAVPKRRMSKSRKRLRRGHHSAAGPSTQACPRCGSPKLSHRACDSCGYYRGKKQVEVAGAVQALTALPDPFVVQLVGRPDVIRAELAKHPAADQSRLEIREAAEVIGMAEKPLAAV